MKYIQTKNDLKNHFNEQINFIHKSCAEYDKGDFSEAKRIAVALRILLHNTTSSHSLFSQLNMNDFVFKSSGDLYTPSNLLSSNTLCGYQITANDITFVPHLFNASHRNFYLFFEDWWNEIIIDDKEVFLTRKDIVLYVANQDGGAHIDPVLKKEYANLVKNNSLGLALIKDEENIPPRNNPALAIVRQVAFEFLDSLVQNNLNFTKTPHKDRLFEMRFTDETKRFKWSSTDITTSEETMIIVNTFNKVDREFFTYKATGYPQLEVII